MSKTQTLPAILASRLSEALKKNGIAIRHSTALRVTAAAYGYHNEHEISAAAAEDRIALSAAENCNPEDLGSAISMQVMTDPKTGRRFAFETGSFPKIKTIISPDGTLMTTQASESPAVGALILTESNNATKSGAIEAIGKEPGYPRAIAVIDYADMLPQIENTHLDLDDDQKADLSMKLVEIEADRIWEGMVSKGTEICANIWNEFMENPEKYDSLKSPFAERSGQTASTERFSKSESLCQTPDFTIPNHPGELFSIEMNFRSEESLNGGDFDPTDPSDIECIRTTLLRKSGHETYEAIDNTSYATTLATSISQDMLTAYISGLVATLSESDGTIIPRLLREYSNTSPKMIASSELKNISAKSMADIVRVRESSNACYLVSTFIRPEDRKAWIEIMVKESDPQKGDGYYRIPRCETASYLPVNPSSAQIMALHMQAIAQVEKAIKGQRPIHTALSLLTEKRTPDDIAAFSGPEQSLDDETITMIADYAFETDNTLATVDIENDNGWTTTEDYIPDSRMTCIRKMKTFFYHREDAGDKEDTEAGKFAVQIAKNGTILQIETSL